jgi:hypothetical protein
MKTKMRLPSGHSKSARQRAVILKNGVYQLKVVLARSEPPIWRRVLVPGEYTLAALHHVLQRVMGWRDEHLHDFVIEGARYGRTARGIDFGDPELLNESRAALRDVLPAAGKSFLYEYNFGDDWIHDIKVEKVLVRDEGVSYPSCLGGENACPPEDCGGIFGYYDKLEIIKDPSHPDYEDFKDWMGRFDPAAFSLEAVNRSLRALSRKRG